MKATAQMSSRVFKLKLYHGFIIYCIITNMLWYITKYKTFNLITMWYRFASKHKDKQAYSHKYT